MAPIAFEWDEGNISKSASISIEYHQKRRKAALLTGIRLYSTTGNMVAMKFVIFV
jgi:hypothetical protein